jgi:hypothetical protein
MHKLFTPATILMSRLNFHRKFMVLGLIYLIAMTVVVCSLYVSLNQVIHTAQRQLEGIELIKPITKTIQLMQQHRDLVVGIYGGNKSVHSQRETKAIETASAFSLVEQRLPVGLMLSNDWTRIKSDWDRLQNDSSRGTADENFAAHSALIDRVLKFEADVADNYALTFAANIDAFYLIDTATHQWPSALEQLSQIRAVGLDSLTTKQISEARKIEIITLMSELRHALKFLSVNFEKQADSILNYKARWRLRPVI